MGGAEAALGRAAVHTGREKLFLVPSTNHSLKVWSEGLLFLAMVVLFHLFDTCLVCVQLVCRISPLSVNVGSP